MKNLILRLVSLLWTCTAYQYPFLDPTLDWDERVEDLVDRLTIEEIITQSMMVYDQPTPGIPRLGIQPHVWISECLHGHVNSNGTTFPQSLGKSENTCRHCSLFRVSFTVSSLKTSATHNVTRYAHARFQCQPPFFGRV